MRAVVDRLGFSRSAFRLVVFIHEWALAQAHYGDASPAVERIVERSGSSRPTFFRRLDEFRRAFPEYATPADMIVWPHGVPQPDDVDLVDWRAVVA